MWRTQTGGNTDRCASQFNNGTTRNDADSD
jgi:hypothetical protein